MGYLQDFRNWLHEPQHCEFSDVFRGLIYLLSCVRTELEIIQHESMHFVWIKSILWVWSSYIFSSGWIGRWYIQRVDWSLIHVYTCRSFFLSGGSSIFAIPFEHKLSSLPSLLPHLLFQISSLNPCTFWTGSNLQFKPIRHIPVL